MEAVSEGVGVMLWLRVFEDEGEELLLAVPDLEAVLEDVTVAVGDKELERLGDNVFEAVWLGVTVAVDEIEAVAVEEIEMDREGVTVLLGVGDGECDGVGVEVGVEVEVCEGV